MVKLKGSLCIFIFLTIFLSNGCKDDSQNFSESPLIIRIPEEPDNLHPMYSRGSHATPIEQMIFYPLAEFDPKSLQLTPLLIEELVQPDTLKNGPYAGGLAFHYTIREQAQWSDGTPVTAKDYIFTIKTAFNAYSQASVWKSYLAFIGAVEIDQDNPKNFTVFATEPYMLAEQVVCNFNIFPAHVYDSTQVLEAFTLQELAEMETNPLAPGRDSLLSAFGEQFRSLVQYRGDLVGTGPYDLDAWETGQFIRLKRKQDWWGDKVADRPLLMHAYPDYIEYRIIPDETTALNAMKEGTIDLIADVSPSKFVELRDDPQLQERFNFYTPTIMRYNCLELNNTIPELQDQAVRKALAYSIDYQTMMDQIASGLATRTIGPFHPDQVYYNDTIEPIGYDLEKAKALLKDAGWKDTDQDGTVDKMINGRQQELVLDFLVTQKEEGRNLSLLIRQNAEKAGIGINLQTTEGTKLVQDWRSRNYEVIPLQRSTHPGYNDPYQSWHSKSNVSGGNNRTGYVNAHADTLIEQIRSTVDPEKRKSLYFKLQEQLYEDQPVIFLYAPLARVIVSNTYEVVTSARRPGYFEHLFQLNTE